MILHDLPGNIFEAIDTGGSSGGGWVALITVAGAS